MSTFVNSAKLFRILKRSVPVADIPTFLCPGLLQIAHSRTSRWGQKQTQPPSRHQSRRFLSTPTDSPLEIVKENAVGARKKLPQQCPGCGAFSQTIMSKEPGHYDVNRKLVKQYLGVAQGAQTRVKEEEAIVKSALKQAGDIGVGLSLDNLSRPEKVIEVPFCDRCHNLKEHQIGVSIQHPTIQSIEDTIFESPYKYNHVYHVLDAADFPMSIIPGLHKLLNITPQRSLNRRSKTGRFYHGRKTEVSFVIQRADLLTHKQAQCNSLMPYLRLVLRDALGRAGKDIRLGNIRCISANQSWWTKELKEEIWKRGGGGWLVGKVNVGKSMLLHAAFPKGRKDLPEDKHRRSAVLDGSRSGDEEDGSYEDQSRLDPQRSLNKNGALDASLLLPPTPPETDYPVMPLVSALPGTTASPIRLPFGNGKGELVDLPGLSRSGLELHVQPEHRSSLIMHSRIDPEQVSIRDNQSLLLGGFIRITPTTPGLLFLSYNFTPLEEHVTRTEDKAIPTQLQARESGIENISLPGTGESIKSAGIFHLKWDVTRERCGPLTSKNGKNMKPEKLPFRVFSTDILIEGCGWIELVAQVRKKPFEMTEVREKELAQIWKAAEELDSESPESEYPESEQREENSDDLEHEKESSFQREEIDPIWPVVEVFTPEGKFIAQRRPMNAWILREDKPGKGSVKGRPRKSMKGVKKAEKARKRAHVMSQNN